jgi:small subunit ribosomal protein S20
MSHLLKFFRRDIKMANIKSAIKRIRVTERRTLRNKMVKSAVKTAIKKFEIALNSGNIDEAKVLYAQAVKALDKAAAKGVIHKNAASRKKSRLTVKLNKALA